MDELREIIGKGDFIPKDQIVSGYRYMNPSLYWDQVKIINVKKICVISKDIWQNIQQKITKIKWHFKQYN